MEERLTQIENILKGVQARNSKVEMDKAWEISWARRLFIATSTYIVAVIWLIIINDTDPWLKALVPVLGFLLSTLSLPFVKKWWVQK